jgi:16S rRNA U1498 N3-methylase RsmE
LITEKTEYIIFDKQDWAQTTFNIQHPTFNICGIVGPEGGLTNKDYTLRAEAPHHIQQLGNGVLRTETWAIIGGRLIKNN